MLHNVETARSVWHWCNNLVQIIWTKLYFVQLNSYAQPSVFHCRQQLKILTALNSLFYPVTSWGSGLKWHQSVCLCTTLLRVRPDCLLCRHWLRWSFTAADVPAYCQAALMAGMQYKNMLAVLRSYSIIAELHCCWWLSIQSCLISLLQECFVSQC